MFTLIILDEYLVMLNNDVMWASLGMIDLSNSKWEQSVGICIKGPRLKFPFTESNSSQGVFDCSGNGLFHILVRNVIEMSTDKLQNIFLYYLALERKAKHFFQICNSIWIWFASKPKKEIYRKSFGTYKNIIYSRFTFILYNTFL